MSNFYGRVIHEKLVGGGGVWGKEMGEVGRSIP